MLFIVVVVFIAVFAAVLLVAVALGADTAKQQKQVLQRLESISMASQRGSADETVDILREEMLSSIPWLNRWLQESDLFPKLRNFIRQADLSWTVTGLILMSLGCGVAGVVAVYWRTGAVPLALMVGGGCTTLPFLYVGFKRQQRFGQFEERLPESLELMVNALRAGHSLISAIEMVAREMPKPIGEEFRKCFDEQNFGLDLRDAMLNMAQRVPIHDVQIMVTAILIQKESGGNLAEILEKVAYVIRERFRLKRQIRVHTAQGRMTGWILAMLPPTLGFLLYLIKPEHMSRLWTDETGIKLLYASVIMTTIGALIIRKIVRIRV